MSEEKRLKKSAARKENIIVYKTQTPALSSSSPFALFLATLREMMMPALPEVKAIAAA